jgi:hypothetical protein
MRNRHSGLTEVEHFYSIGMAGEDGPGNRPDKEDEAFEENVLATHRQLPKSRGARSNCNRGRDLMPTVGKSRGSKRKPYST